MIPAPAATLNALAMKLLTDIAPHAGSSYAVADSALIAQLLLTYAQEFETAIELRMQDVAALKSLFETAPDHAPLLAEREAFIEQEPASLRLSDVNAVHDQGMRLLIELQAWAEQRDAGLNEEIWRALREQTDRHRFELP